MELNEDEKRLAAEACAYMDAHAGELIERFVTSKNPLRLGFITIFMAGSPGAGKTEFSQKYLPLIFNERDGELQKLLAKKGVNISEAETLLVRIDVDEIRSFLPQYRKTDAATAIKANAHVIQQAANKGLDILRNFCLTNDISFLHDGTFGNYSTMREIIKKSIRAGREVHIYYLYLDPLTAWEFTKAREFLEGRNIIKEKFINQYVKSKENVDRAKEEFGDAVKVHCVLKNEKNEVEEIVFNWPSIDRFLLTQERKGIIRRYSAEELSNLIT